MQKKKKWARLIIMVILHAQSSPVKAYFVNQYISRILRNFLSRNLVFASGANEMSIFQNFCGEFANRSFNCKFYIEKHKHVQFFDENNMWGIWRQKMSSFKISQANYLFANLQKTEILIRNSKSKYIFVSIGKINFFE